MVTESVGDRDHGRAEAAPHRRSGASKTCEPIWRVVSILTACLLVTAPACDSAAAPDEEQPPTGEEKIRGLYELQTIDDNSLPLIFEPVGGDSAGIEKAYLALRGDPSEVLWGVLFDQPPPDESLSQGKTGKNTKRELKGTWRLIEEDRILLEYQDGTVDTGRVVSYVPRDRRALGDTLTLILRSFGSDWVYELRIRGDP